MIALLDAKCEQCRTVSKSNQSRIFLVQTGPDSFIMSEDYPRGRGMVVAGYDRGRDILDCD